jgi:hypothetical protein
VHEQRLGRIAGAQLLRLGVVDDGERHLQIGRGVDVDVAVAVEVLDDRHLRFAGDALDQPLAAARNDHVDGFRRGDQVADDGPIGRRHELHRVARQAGVDERRLHQRRQRQVRLQRLRAAAQDAGVAALDGERRGLDGHVGPALVDHGEDAERHPHAADLDPARLLAQVGDGADRVGHGGDLLAALRHGLDACRIEAEPFQQRRGEPGLARRIEVLAVGAHQRCGGGAEPTRQLAQGVVARRQRRSSEAMAGGARQCSHVRDGRLEVGRGHARIVSECRGERAPSR